MTKSPPLKTRETVPVRFSRMGFGGLAFFVAQFVGFVALSFYQDQLQQLVGAVAGPLPLIYLALVLALTWFALKPRSFALTIGSDGLFLNAEGSNKRHFLAYASIRRIRRAEEKRGPNSTPALTLFHPGGPSRIAGPEKVLKEIIDSYETWKGDEPAALPGELERSKESVATWEARLRAELKNPDYRSAPPRTLVRVAVDPKQTPETRQVAARIAHDLFPHHRDELEAAAEETAHPEVGNALRGRPSRG